MLTTLCYDVGLCENYDHPDDGVDENGFFRGRTQAHADRLLTLAGCCRLRRRQLVTACAWQVLQSGASVGVIRCGR